MCTLKDQSGVFRLEINNQFVKIGICAIVTSVLETDLFIYISNNKLCYGRELYKMLVSFLIIKNMLYFY